MRLSLLVPALAVLASCSCPRRCAPCPQVTTGPPAPAAGGAVGAVAVSPAAPAGGAPKAGEAASARAPLSLDELERRLRAAAKAPDPAAAIASLVAEQPRAARSLPAEAWLAVGSEGLRLYDLADVLTPGGDARSVVFDTGTAGGAAREEGAFLDFTPASDPLGGAGEGDEDVVDGRVRRVAAAVRASLPSEQWPAARTFVAERPDGILVLQSPDRFGAIEKALDGVAVVGGRVVRVAVLHATRGAEVGAAIGVDTPGGGWTRAAPGQAAGGGTWSLPALDDAPWARAVALAASDPLVVVVEGDGVGRAERSSRMAYLRDFDVETGNSQVSSPVIGSLEAGFAATVGLTGEEAEVQARWCRVEEPLPTFATSTATAFPVPVTIELPVAHVDRASLRLPARAGAAAFVQESPGGPAFLARVGEVEAGEPRRPAWRRRTRVAVPVPGEDAKPYVSVVLEVERQPASGPPKAVASPQIGILPGQRGMACLAERTSYLSGFVARSAGSVVVDPAVSSLSTGLSMEFRVTSGPDDSVVLSGVFRRVDLDRPMRTLETTFGPGRSFAIQLPRTWTTLAPFRVRLAPGAPRVLSIPAWGPGGREEIRVRVSFRWVAVGPGEPANGR